MYTPLRLARHDFWSSGEDDYVGFENALSRASGEVTLETGLSLEEAKGLAEVLVFG